MPTKRPRNPQDATLRNARASRKREYALRLRVIDLEARVGALEQTVIRRLTESPDDRKRR